MARIIVTCERSGAEHDLDAVLLDEQVEPVHLSSEHGAGQLIERLRWAVADAAALEHAPAQLRPARTGARARKRPGYSAASALA